MGELDTPAYAVPTVTVHSEGVYLFSEKTLFPAAQHCEW